MADILTAKATVENNEFESCYQKFLGYKKNVDVLPKHAKAVDESRRERQKKKDDLATHEKLRSNFIERAYSASMKKRVDAIEADYKKRIATVESQIADCDAELNRAKGGQLTSDDVFNSLFRQRSKELPSVSQYTDKVNRDLTSYGVTLSQGAVARALNNTRISLRSQMTYNLMHQISSDVPNDYFVMPSKKKVSIKNIAMKILMPPFVYTNRKTKAGTARKDGSKQFDIVNALIYWAVLLSVIGFALWMGIETGILYVLLAIAAIIVAAIVVVPKLLVSNKLKKASSFYLIVLERDSWLRQLVQQEVAWQVYNNQEQFNNVLGEITSQREQLVVQRDVIVAERNLTIESVDASEVRRDAENEYNAEVIRLDDLVLDSEEKFERAEQIKRKTESEIDAYLSAKDVFEDQLRTWMKASREDPKLTRTNGMLWDSIYFNGNEESEDKNGVKVINKLTHNLQPQVLLYDSDSNTPATELSDLIIQMAGTTVMSYPSKFVKVFAVDTVGGATAFMNAMQLVTPIGKTDQIKLLEGEVDTVQKRITTNIADENDKRIKNGDNPYSHVIAFIFVPKGDVSASTNILSENLKQQIRQKGRNGFLPIFIIFENDWNQLSGKSSSVNQVIEIIKKEFVDIENVHHVDFRKLIIKK